MSIYTRRGDQGETSLADGTRASKADARVEAYGAIDEANAAVGLAVASVADPLLLDVLEFVQHRLLNCAAALAAPADAHDKTTPTLSLSDCAVLERAIDQFMERSGAGARFTIGGGCDTSARLQLARTVVRRAERRASALAAAAPVDVEVLAFLNRSSDLLFASAQYIDALEDTPEEPWDPVAPQPQV